MKHLYITTVLVLLAISCHGQAQSPKGYFLYEPEKFTPPTKALIATFEGQPAEPFLANDVTGVEQYLPDYRGKKVVLWFWDTQNALATSQIHALNQAHGLADVSVVSMARQTSSVIKDYLQTVDVRFPVVGNADVFGQMAYGASLGYPRLFLIDKDGIIKVVLPAEAFAGEDDIFPILEGIIGGL